jgi:hypothetical protein
LALTNISFYLTPKKILGSQTEEKNNDAFWMNLLSSHPNYIPGWIELNQKQKVEEIDPNYIIP